MEKIKTKINGLSNRERILLIILIVIIAYYLLVQLPISKINRNLNARQMEVSSRIDEDTVKLASLSKMTKDLNAWKSAGRKPIPLPQYDNANNIITEMDTILGGSQNYTLTFGDETEENGIIRREIELHFSAESFDAAVQKLKKMENSENNYLIKDSSIAVSDNTKGQSVNVVLYMTSFERR